MCWKHFQALARTRSASVLLVKAVSILGGRPESAYALQRYRRSGRTCGVASLPLSGVVLSCLHHISVSAVSGSGISGMASPLGFTELVGTDRG